MENKSRILYILLILFVFISGFLLRIESVSETKMDVSLRNDALDYFTYAYNLRHHDIYSKDTQALQGKNGVIMPDAFRPPGYPLFLVPFVNGLPNDNMIKNILLFQAVLSTITMILAFFLIKNFLSPYFSAFAAFLVGISPHLIIMNSYLLTETLFCFFLVLIVLLVGMLGKKPTLWLGITIGILMGFASLIRSSLQYFIFLTAIFLMFHYGWKRGARISIFIMLGFGLVFGTWIVRNRITLQKYSDNRLTVNFLHHGMYPDFTFDNIPESYGFPYRYDPDSREISEDIPSVLKEIIRRFDQETIKHCKWFLIGKPVAFWSWDIVNGVGDVFVYPVITSPYFNDSIFWLSHELMRKIHWILTVLCLSGCILSFFPGAFITLPKESIFITRFISVILIYYTLIHMIGAPFPRYSIPLRPFLCGMALFVPCQVLDAMIRFYRTNRKSKTLCL